MGFRAANRNSIFLIPILRLGNLRIEHMASRSKILNFNLYRNIAAPMMHACMHACWPTFMYERIDAWDVWKRKSYHCKSLLGAVCCCLWGYEDLSLFFLSLSLRWGWVESDKVDIECGVVSIFLASPTDLCVVLPLNLVWTDSCTYEFNGGLNW